MIELGALGDSSRELCRAALRYIGRCHAILASVYGMRNCPVFHAAHRYRPAPLLCDTRGRSVQSPLTAAERTGLCGPPGLGMLGFSLKGVGMCAMRNAWQAISSG